MSKLKVCSFNLRVDSERDGINCFSNRFPRVLEVINNENPDIIGFQEATEKMRKQLSDALHDYTILGCGRNTDYSGESAAIAVKRESFEIISYESFWLSFTPSVPGSCFGGDQSSCPRITSSVLLKPNGSDNLVRFCNTHLDHKGNAAKLLGISQIMQYLSQFSERFILTGDFNAKPDSEVVSALNRMVHNGRQVTEATRMIDGTFHDYGRRETLTKIDYIFTDGETEPTDAYLIAYPPVDGIFVSDHHPVAAYIEI